MFLVLVLSPLVGFLCAIAFGRFLGWRGAAIVTTGLTFVSAVLSGYAFYTVGLLGEPQVVIAFDWIQSGLVNVPWGFMFDSVTVTMCVVVTWVSTLVHLYSTEYMNGDPHHPRFMSYLSLFTFFMLMLVTGSNLVQLFLGWEGVGLASYLLINFWFTRIDANKAAIKAFVVNRVGDFGLALGLVGIFATFKCLDYPSLFALCHGWEGTTIYFLGSTWSTLDLLGILLFVGAVGKSAQLGLHTWLPDAMEGPTPVSALIHAATMVTAGVFLVVRCSPLFEYAPTALCVVAVVGGMTALFAASIGLVQNDMKKVIAYSTCSQLGYMVFAAGLSQYQVAIFHLSNHAFFKALLFLGAGSVIHAMGDEQDMRKMGGLVRLLPFTYIMMVIGSLALMGFPFLTGFYSKDLILEVAAGSFSVPGTFVHWLGCLAAFFTAFYSFRLLYLVFLKEPQGSKTDYAHVHESPLCMSVPLFILALGSLFVGYLTRDLFVGLGTDFWGNSIYIAHEHNVLIEAEFLSPLVKNMPFLVSMAGAASAVYIYHSCHEALSTLHLRSPFVFTLYKFLNRKWYFDRLQNELIAAPAMKFGYNISFKTLDKGLFEMVGPYGIMRLVRGGIKAFSGLQSGLVSQYAFMMVLGFACLLFGITSNMSGDLLGLYGVLLFALIVVNASKVIGGGEALKEANEQAAVCETSNASVSSKKDSKGVAAKKDI